MAKYFSSEWFASRNTGQNVALTLLTLPLGAARLGGAAVRTVQASRAGGAVRVISAAKRPVHTAAIGMSKFRYQRFHLNVGYRPKSHTLLTRSMVWRKRAGLTATGISLLNPFQTLRYARQGDWDRVAINLRYPIVGVPIYDFIQSRRGSGAPSPAAAHGTKKNRRKSRRPSTGPAGSSYNRSKDGARSSTRPSGRPSGAKRHSRAQRAQKKCPRGYYWSWKKRQCVKSKFR